MFSNLDGFFKGGRFSPFCFSKSANVDSNTCCYDNKTLMAHFRNHILFLYCFTRPLSLSFSNVILTPVADSSFEMTVAETQASFGSSNHALVPFMYTCKACETPEESELAILFFFYLGLKERRKMKSREKGIKSYK